ncbi:hypothetical protein Tco_1494538, partial [Tanacetum coccineum]
CMDCGSDSEAEDGSDNGMVVNVKAAWIVEDSDVSG